MGLDVVELKVLLTRRRMTQRDLAARLGHAPSTLWDWVHGSHPAPADLTQRIERTLGAAPGTLGAGR